MTWEGRPGTGSLRRALVGWGKRERHETSTGPANPSPSDKVMTWVKLDDAFADHPKYDNLAELAPFAIALQIRALCYSNRYLTDGAIPRSAIGHLTRHMPSDYEWPEVMVKAGLWDRGPNGWAIHDFSEYQPSKAKVEAERAAARDRMQAARARRQPGPDRSPERIDTAGAIRSLERSPEQGRSPERSGEGSPYPGPSRPVPKDLNTPGPGLNVQPNVRPNSSPERSAEQEPKPKPFSAAKLRAAVEAEQARKNGNGTPPEPSQAQPGPELDEAERQGGALPW